MNLFAKTFALTACATAVSLMISACGGGASTDNVKPVLNNVTQSAPDASGVVTFTFTFSKAIFNFAPEKVTVTGGTVVAAAQQTCTVCTLNVKPTTATTPVTVAFNASSLSDLAGNPILAVAATSGTSVGATTTASGATTTASGSTTTASGSTTTASGSTTTASGSTTTASGSTTTASGSTTTASGSTTTASGSTTTASGSTTTASGSTTTASGSTTTTGSVPTTTAAPGAAPTVAITASPMTGGNVRFIFNFSANVGTTFTTSDVVITGGYAATVGAAPAVGVQQSTTNPLVYTLDVTPASTAAAVSVNVAAGAFSASGVASTAAATLNYTVPFIFASDYYDGGTGTSVGIDPATGTSKIASAESGAFGIYGDTAAAGGVKATIWWGKVFSTFGKSTDPNVSWGWGIDGTATKPGWLGGYVNAPNNGTADVSARNNLEIVLNANVELAATSPTFTVLLVSPDVGTGAAACTPKLTGTVKLTDTTGKNFPLYKLPLNGFTLNSPACTGYPTAADVLKKVSAVHVQALQASSAIQYVTQAKNPDGSLMVPATYANGFVLGKIYFD